MGLLLICPHCQAKLPLACRTCPACGADLQDLPRKLAVILSASREAAAGPRPWS